MYVYIYTYTCIFMHICSSFLVYIYLSVCIYVHIYICMYMYVYMYKSPTRMQVQALQAWKRHTRSRQELRAAPPQVNSSGPEFPINPRVQ